MKNLSILILLLFLTGCTYSISKTPRDFSFAKDAPPKDKGKAVLIYHFIKPQAFSNFTPIVKYEAYEGSSEAKFTFTPSTYINKEGTCSLVTATAGVWSLSEVSYQRYSGNTTYTNFNNFKIPSIYNFQKNKVYWLGIVSSNNGSLLKVLPVRENPCANYVKASYPGLSGEEIIPIHPMDGKFIELKPAAQKNQDKDNSDEQKPEKEKNENPKPIKENSVNTN